MFDESKGTDLYRSLRPLLFSIAYRMLGSVSEAEDVVQDAFLRYHRAVEDGADIASPKAYLATVATRLSLDVLRSARVRRESYVGAWLPEPLLEEPGPDAAEHAEIADSLSLAFLVLLESLTPAERAVFLLREVFGYPYSEIAEVVDRSEESCRQLAVRARRHVEARRPRFEASRERRDELAARFFAASEDGDLPALEKLLAADVTYHGDGGGKAPAARRVIAGPAKVARLISGLMVQGREAGITRELVQVNGQPGLLCRTAEGLIVNVWSLDIVDGRVQTIRGIVNPDKLAHLGAVADLRAFTRSARRGH